MLYIATRRINEQIVDQSPTFFGAIGDSPNVFGAIERDIEKCGRVKWDAARGRGG